jgi:hypothetical protein
MSAVMSKALAFCLKRLRLGVIYMVLLLISIIRWHRTDDIACPVDVDSGWDEDCECCSVNMPNTIFSKYTCVTL